MGIRVSRKRTRRYPLATPPRAFPVSLKKPRKGLNPDPTRTHPAVRLATSAVGPGSGP